MFTSSRIALSAAMATAVAAALATPSAHAAPEIQFTPSTSTIAVGQVFDVLLTGTSFDATSGGTPIANVTGGQNLQFSFDPLRFEVLSVSIDPRWTFAAGNKPGVIDPVNGSISGMAFGVFPATTDDDFDIATFTLRALAPGAGALVLNSGQFIGTVGGKPGQLITASFGEAAISVGSVVPEPQQWALLLAGLGLVALRRRPRDA